MGFKMNKKQAVVCTIMFAILIATIVVGSMFIPSKSGDRMLFDMLGSFSVGFLASEFVVRFYKWVRGNGGVVNK